MLDTSVHGLISEALSGPEDIPLAERKRLNECLRRRMKTGAGSFCGTGVICKRSTHTHTHCVCICMYVYINEPASGLSLPAGLKKGLVAQWQATTDNMQKFWP